MSAESRMFIASVNSYGDGVAGAAKSSPSEAISAVVELVDDDEWRAGEPTFTVTLHEVERLIPSSLVDDEWFGDDEDGEPASAYLLLDALDDVTGADFRPSSIDLTQADTDALADILDVPAAQRAATFDAWAASHPNLDYGWWSIISVDNQTRWEDLEIDPDAASWDGLLPAWAKDIDPCRVAIRFSVADDYVATRVADVIESVGYASERVDDIAPMTAAPRLERLAGIHSLCEREVEIYGFIVEGLTNAAIGKRLDISRETVKWHMHNMFVKTGVVNREGLLRMLLVDGAS